MTPQEIENKCSAKQKELLDKYFGNLVHEAAIEQPETIGEYTHDLPQKIGDEFRLFLEDLWQVCAPDGLKGTTLVLEEQKLRELMTEGLHNSIEEAYQEATDINLWERITQTNHKDVTYYKGLLHVYTRQLLDIMQEDFMEEITGNQIANKAFAE